jgi:nitroreductase
MPSVPPFHALLAARFTTHAFDRERPLSAEDELSLLEAARWAPSWKSREPWRFVACNRFTHPEAWQTVFDSLARPERPWAYNVALYLLVAVDFAEVEPELHARALFDAGGAALQLCLEATARDLATNVTSGFDAARLRAGLGLPEDVSPVAVVCVGHRADLGTLGRDVYRREVTPRTRAPLGSRCFEARWGNAKRCSEQSE